MVLTLSINSFSLSPSKTLRIISKSKDIPAETLSIVLGEPAVPESLIREVIKNPITKEPYIPGSSLKGKMRSELEKEYGAYTIFYPPILNSLLVNMQSMTGNVLQTHPNLPYLLY